MPIKCHSTGTESLPEDLTDILACNRNIFISDDLKETGVDPLVISVQYLGIGNCHKAVILDNELMPVIRAAVEKYVRKRNRLKKKFGENWASW